jgi:hypothetical protein
MKSQERKSMIGIFYRLFEILSSLELAVCLILTLAVVLATGTIYESKFGAAVASREVYRSFWMQILLWLFMMNLAAVAMSRLPWKRSHIGFLVTHLGIITLLLGSWITQRRGVDGTLALSAGESGRAARVDENMLYVFRVEAGKAYDLVLNQSLDLDPRRPMTKPQEFSFEDGGQKRVLKVVRYLPKAERIIRAIDVPPNAGVPALKFELTGSRATFSDWLFLEADTGTTREIGPAVIKLAAKKPDLSLKPAKPTLVLYFGKDHVLPPLLAVARKGEAFRELGRPEVGKALALGWMDFSFILQEFHASAAPSADYKPLEKGVGPMNEGVEVLDTELGGKPLSLELGASGQVSLGDALYYVQFTKRQVDLGFELTLKKFHIGYYEGTTQPKTYSSDVEVGGHGQTISMNEPLKHNGYTVYQSSYEADTDGSPKYSILSVNLDPGRPVKYVGSLMIVFGIISMFYFKPVYSGKSKWLGSKKEGQSA